MNTPVLLPYSHAPAHDSYTTDQFGINSVDFWDLHGAVNMEDCFQAEFI